MIQFLIDECLSPRLREVARDLGYVAYHVTQRGWSSFPDRRLFPLVLEHDLTLVTNNWRDFRPMLRRTEVHPGVVVIIPNVRRERQVELFTRVLDTIRSADPPLDMVNTVLEVDASGEVIRYALPEEG